jgi:3-oxoacyl-[acyl-carrier-protein] synthase III
MSKVIVNIEKYGNMSSATVPVALDEAIRNKKIRRSDIIVLVAFGAGLTWGSVLARY